MQENGGPDQEKNKRDHPSRRDPLRE